MTQFKITFLPYKTTVTVPAGTDLLSASVKAGIHIYNSCGGDGVCGRCKVVVRKGEYSAEQSGRISQEDRKRGYVLACRAVPHSDLTVLIPEESRMDDVTALTGSRLSGVYKPIAIDLGEDMVEPSKKIFRHGPLSTKIHLSLPRPTVDDNIGDAERLFREIKKGRRIPVMQMGLANIKRLPSLLRESDWNITVTLGSRNGTTEVVLIEPGDRSDSNLGVALDVGTTTIVACLVDLNSRKLLGVKANYNPQVDFGEDVISRIIYAEEDNGLEKLHHVVVDSVNSLIDGLLKEVSLTLNDITAVLCAGNTTMIHLLLKIKPGYIRKDPYVPVVNFPPVIRAAEAGIKINPRGLLACIPSVGSYVGGDIIAGILASGMDDTDELSLFIDLGTNGEIAIGNKQYFVACSTSAGPCFEGGGLSSGVRAMKGAIESVFVENGRIKVKTIGDAPAKGICGSGVIEVISVFLEHKVIDRAGRIKDNDLCMVEERGGARAVVIKKGEESATGDEVIIDENDIKNVINSKGAIYTGIETLLKESGYAKEQLKHVFISGGLGAALNIRSAINIGLLPDIREDKFEFLGNTSIAGARACILSDEALKKAYLISEKTAYLDLSGSPSFMNNYSAALFLPHTDIEKFPSVKKIL